VAESSSARVVLTTEEVMELTTCWYIDYPGVGVIDLEAPQLPEVYKVLAEWMFNELTIMETIALVLKALQEYERAGGFAPAVAADAEDVSLAAPTAHVELTTDASLPPHINEGQGSSPRQPLEATEALAPIAEVGAAEAVVGGEGVSSSHPVAKEGEGVESRVLDEPATIVRESAAPEMMTRGASLEIREAEEIRASLSQGAAGGEARTLDLACASWAVTFGLDDDSDDDEEVVARHTFERGMTWVRCAFDELILPATSVSLPIKDYLLDPVVFSGYTLVLFLLAADPRVFRSEMCPRGAQTPH
jgi:hypothetical protein